MSAEHYDPHAGSKMAGLSKEDLCFLQSIGKQNNYYGKENNEHNHQSVLSNQIPELVKNQNNSDRRLLERIAIEKERKMNIERKKTLNEFFLAVISSDSPKMNLLINLEKRVHVDNEDENGMTCMHMAAEWNQTESVRFLITQDASVNVLSKKLVSPLECASCKGSLEAARLLIESGADVNNQNIEGLTPLHQSARFGHIDVFELLRLHGGNLHLRVFDGPFTGMTPIELGKKVGLTYFKSMPAVSRPDCRVNPEEFEVELDEIMEKYEKHFQILLQLAKGLEKELEVKKEVKEYHKILQIQTEELMTDWQTVTKKWFTKKNSPPRQTAI